MESNKTRIRSLWWIGFVLAVTLMAAWAEEAPTVPLEQDAEMNGYELTSETGGVLLRPYAVRVDGEGLDGTHELRVLGRRSGSPIELTAEVTLSSGYVEHGVFLEADEVFEVVLHVHRFERARSDSVN